MININDTIKQLARSKDAETGAEMVKNANLVEEIALKYKKRWDLYWDDIVEAGIMGMERAAERFDRKRGPFRPFAARSIEGFIINGLKEVTRDVVVNEEGEREYIKFERLSGVNEEGEYEIEIPDDSEANITERMEKEQRVREISEKLSPEEERIFMVMLGRSGEKYSDIARDMGISSSAISQKKENLIIKIQYKIL